MGASAQRGLPLLFPLYALLSLLRDVALALVLLAWHSALLAPRVAWHALRGGRGAASPPDPGCEYYEGTVTHTRLLPVLHAFSYPVRPTPQKRFSSHAHAMAPTRGAQVRNVLVDLDAPPAWFTRQKARAPLLHRVIVALRLTPRLRSRTA
jgi:hypothetical protein